MHAERGGCCLDRHPRHVGRSWGTESGVACAGCGGSARTHRIVYRLVACSLSAITQSSLVLTILCLNPPTLRLLRTYLSYVAASLPQLEEVRLLCKQQMVRPSLRPNCQNKSAQGNDRPKRRRPWLDSAARGARPCIRCCTHVEGRSAQPPRPLVIRSPNHPARCPPAHLRCAAPGAPVRGRRVCPAGALAGGARPGAVAGDGLQLGAARRRGRSLSSAYCGLAGVCLVRRVIGRPIDFQFFWSGRCIFCAGC
jgi:hypothetical protein